MSRKIITYFKNHLIRLNNTVLEINKSPFSNNKLCMDAQLEILDLIISLERKTRNLNSQKDNLSKMLHKKSDPLLTKNQSISIKMEISEIEKRTKEYFFVIRILRGIADGIVFTYFNKWDVKQYTFKEDVGFISGKKGLILEKRVFNLSYRMGLIAIFNDITSCLKHGDITVIRENYPPKFIECKSSKRDTKRLINQQNSLEKILKTFYEGEFEYEGYKGKCVQLINIEKNYSYLLANQFNECLKTGFSTINPEKGICFFAFNFSNFDLVEKEIIKFSDPLIFAFNPYLFEPAYVPISLLLNDSEMLYSFYNEEVNLLVIVDKMEISKRIECYELNSEFLENDPNYFF